MAGLRLGHKLGSPPCHGPRNTYRGAAGSVMDDGMVLGRPLQRKLRLASGHSRLFGGPSMGACSGVGGGSQNTGAHGTVEMTRMTFV